MMRNMLLRILLTITTKNAHDKKHTLTHTNSYYHYFFLYSYGNTTKPIIIIYKPIAMSDSSTPSCIVTTVSNTIIEESHTIPYYPILLLLLSLFIQTIQSINLSTLFTAGDPHYQSLTVVTVVTVIITTY